MIDAEATASIGAAAFERSGDRITQRVTSRSASPPAAESGISTPEVSRICTDLDAEVGAFRDRDLDAMGFPYVFLDAIYCKARVKHPVVSQVVVVAVGRREVLGVDLGNNENERFWTGLLRSLKARRLGGVNLVITDAHNGLTKAI